MLKYWYKTQIGVGSLNTRIEVNNVDKVINSKVVLKNISFTLDNNELLIVKGSNGSGKSTLLKLLCGIYKPSRGKIEGLNNISVSYIPDKIPQTINSTVKELLELLLLEYNKDGKEYLVKLIEKFQLNKFLNYRINNCSKGTKQKINIIHALLSNRGLILIDEPTDGLDSNSKMLFVEELNKIKDKAIIIVTHDKQLISSIKESKIYNLDIKDYEFTDKAINYIIKFLSIETNKISNKIVKNNHLESTLVSLINEGNKIEEVRKLEDD